MIISNSCSKVCDISMNARPGDGTQANECPVQLGFNARLEEVTLKLKNFNRSIKIVCTLGSGVDKDSQGYTHATIRVTIPDTGSYDPLRARNTSPINPELST